jgi:predicted tellurium resistance membrane protein TerC
VLGIDNIVFIAILTDKLPEAERPRARRLGLGLAMGMRILLLLGIAWVMGLTEPLFGIPTFWRGDLSTLHEVSGRDLILLVGGLFLIAKATYEIHDKLEGQVEHGTAGAAARSFGAVIVQIGLLDIVFSLDSVITAVGMVEVAPEARWVGLTVMVTAIVISVLVMLAFAGPVSDFVARHPTIKILALSFLILIGVMLVAESFHVHVPKGYIYFAMAFSLVVELLNLRLRRGRDPVTLRETYVELPPPPPEAGAEPGTVGSAESDAAPKP